MQSSQLDDWQDTAAQYYFDSMFDIFADGRVKLDDLDMSVEEGRRIYDLYRRSPCEIGEVLELVLCMGTDSIYGRLDAPDPVSLKRLSDLLDLLQRLKIEPPAVEPVEFSGYEEFHGWGLRFSDERLRDLRVL